MLHIKFHILIVHGTEKYNGFKLMYSQIPPHLYVEFAQWLSQNGIFVVHLTSCFQKGRRRRDGHGKVTHFTRQDDVQAIHDRKVDMNSSKYLKAIAKLENNQHEFSNHLTANVAGNAPYLEMWYE